MVQTRNISMGHQHIQPIGTVNFARNFNENYPIAVEYDEFEDGERRLGLVTKLSESKKWELLSTDGNKKQLDASQFTFQLPHDLQLTKIEDVKRLQLDADVLLHNISISAEQLWVTLKQMNFLLVTCRDVSSILFQRGYEVSAVAAYASHRFLFLHPKYFRSVNGLEFELVDADLINELNQLNESDMKELVKDKFFIAKFANHLIKNNINASKSELYKSLRSKAIKDVKTLDPSIMISDATLSLVENVRDEVFNQLKDVAIEMFPHKNHPTFIRINNILNTFGMDCNDVKSLFDFLHNKCKFFDTPNIHLLRSSFYHSNTPDHITQLESQILNDPEGDQFPDPDVSIRRSLLHQRVYTIDDYSVTEEIDDGISVETLANGDHMLYVHIADPTRYVISGNELDRFALQRSTSVYLPEKKFTMLPHQLCVHIMSLSEHKENCAMTFQARVHSDGQLSQIDAYPSKISKVKRIDYDDLDMLLSGAGSAEQYILDDISIFHKLANYRYKMRMRSGANITFKTPQPNVMVSKSGIVKVNRSNDMSLSRRIVQELMIVANEVGACFSDRNQIMVPYRGTSGGWLPRYEFTKKEMQDFDQDMDPGMGTKSVIEAVYNESREKKDVFYPSACISQSPNWHHGVGVSHYAQVTSPLRRYSDLLIHHQIKAKLRGKEQPMDWSEIEKILSHVEPMCRSVNNLQKNSKRFWLLKYFEESKNKNFKALVLNCRMVQKGLVHNYLLTVYLIDVGHRDVVTSNHPADDKSMIQVKVLEVDPRNDSVKFERV
ncbi:hypothetical protein AKO1_000827 [Acrasis kona]|uniref:RNB domain-containing protein n=1 Tax=Acrasis kona TaxID=1008807 RepID=A0AAW2ZC33_9EUKA